MRNKIRIVFALLVVAVGCKPRSNEVVVYTSVDQVFVEPVLKSFEGKTGIHVKAVYDTEEAKSTGVFNRLVAEASHPQADVFWSGDPVRAALLKKKEILADYKPSRVGEIPARYKDPDGKWTGFSARARILLVNTKKTKALPASYRDLIDPKWKGRAAIANPLFGTTTFHLAALFHLLGKDKGQDFLNRLKSNGVHILPSNGDVKSDVVHGQVAFGFADTDDANEAIQNSKDVVAILPDQDSVGTLVIPNTLCLMARSPNPEQGKKLIDYLLSGEVEAMLEKSAAQMPLLGGLKIPSNFPAKTDKIKDMDVDYNEMATTLDEIQPILKQWAGSSS